MKKKLGFLLAVATLVLSAACASSGVSTSDPISTDTAPLWSSKKAVRQGRGNAAPAAKPEESTGKLRA